MAVSPYVVHDRPEVRHFVDRFQTGYRRAVVERWLSRSGRYLGMIREVFAQRGLPEELVFTAMIESGFDPVAVSRAGAKGLWQFMAPTARRYGLRVDRWIDERLDPEKSTWAAASYLTDLFTMFGSWHLVQAAYNAGEMRVARAVQSKQTSDFWQLSRTRLLAEETKSFVAATQAAALIGREPYRYGFSFTPEDPLRYEVIQVPPSTTLERLAGMSGIATANLRRLNPELRLAQTPPGKPYALKVPVGGEAAVRAAFQKAAAATLMAATKRGRGRDAATTSQARPPARGVHVVKAQDTVGAIAKRYGVSAAEIVRWNLLSAAGRIFPGDRLRVARVAPAEEEGQGGFR
ncbi:MAG: transglycosylase SLT domain-containing protein [Candidatus Rokubacteria bacterium]|nr:transglycosylase SLT domain-containing protein [Candidatus Rokubacteria bacterium]MBI3107481.1 transglycosylase SLT domain-containing protein [Candidatus Rokubacteria bacterium]